MTATDVETMGGEAGETVASPATGTSPAETSPAPAAPMALVIFGATGDLTKRKLMPALYALAVDRLLPERFAVIGAGRHRLSDADFRAAMRDAVSRFARLRLDEEIWRRFAEGLHYATFSEQDGGLEAVRETLESVDRERGTAGNRIYYFAIPPSGFGPLAELLQREGLSREQDGGGFRRLVVEKPFGRNLATARELNAALHGAFEEQQIYRIDHYLGKETVQNALVFRFANGIFEPIWNRRYIDHIQITVAETLGVEGRGAVLRGDRGAPRHHPEPRDAARSPSSAWSRPATSRRRRCAMRRSSCSAPSGPYTPRTPCSTPCAASTRPGRWTASASPATARSPASTPSRCARHSWP